MGFTVAGSREAHEALAARGEAELRLLELIKRSVAAKVKADREYAASLATISSQGLKMDRWDDLGSSIVGSVWRRLMEELENFSRALKSAADTVDKEALPDLANLTQDKRKARKQYLDEYNRMNNNFNNINDEVNRKKADYQKHLEFYRLMRSRFEEYYIKSGRGGKKVDEVRDKYQRACRKLHLVHNEYVLLLAEADQIQRDTRSCLLPTLLHHHQAGLHAALNTWRTVLKEITKQWNLSSKQYSELFSRLESHPDSILPSEEYIDLHNKQIIVDGSSNGSIEFVFDPSLVEDTSGKLSANKLAVDNLTVEWVRSRLADAEPKLKQCQDRLANNTTIHQLSEIELAELKCEEKKLLKQLEVIKKALTELGCEEVPQGCDIPLDHKDMDHNNQDQQSLDSVNHTSTNNKKLTSQGSATTLVDMLKKPFRRKSLPSSPTPGRHNNVNLDGQPIILTPPDSSNETSLTGSTRSLSDEEWFHGVLPREEVVRLLTREGDFLVRETTRNDENQTVLSVCWGGHKHFIVQTTQEGHFRFEGPAFPTISELIAYQYQSSAPVTCRSGAILRTAVPRERWELNNDDVILLDKIGRGNFGDVYKGRLRATEKEVAVKTCRVTVAEEHKRKFLQEGRILKQYDHPNVVKLIGICVQKQPIMIVMELVVGGSLLTYLRNNSSSLACKQLLKMCRDAAAGMCYLESKNCIHRDLAARNCLVGDSQVVKISDFGMSREEEEYIVSDGMKQIPIKWTAPEALNFGKYTSLCDVWSYGVLCWEIFAKGGTPYPGMTNSKAREKIDAGYRMPAPSDIPDEMYRLMLRCWEYQPESRPHFDQILTIVDTLLASYK